LLSFYGSPSVGHCHARRGASTSAARLRRTELGLRDDVANILEQLQQAINVGVGVPRTGHDIAGQSGAVTQRMDATCQYEPAQQDGCGDGKR